MIPVFESALASHRSTRAVSRTDAINLLLKLDHRCRTPRRQNPGVPNLDTTFSAITESLPMITQFNRRKTMRLRSTFPMPLLCQTGRFGGLHKRTRKALHVPVGHNQADRVVQFLLKNRGNRFSMNAACQQYVVVK